MYYFVVWVNRIPDSDNGIQETEALNYQQETEILFIQDEYKDRPQCSNCESRRSKQDRRMLIWEQFLYTEGRMKCLNIKELYISHEELEDEVWRDLMNSLSPRTILL